MALNGMLEDHSARGQFTAEPAPPPLAQTSVNGRVILVPAYVARDKRRLDADRQGSVF